MIEQWEFLERRKALFAQMVNNSIAVIPGALLKKRNGDTDYLFRQDSLFYYLSGFVEPNACLVFIKESSQKTRVILFCLPKKPEEEVWTGFRVGPENACALYGVDEAFSVDLFEEKFIPWLSECETVYSPWCESWNIKMNQWMSVARSRLRKSGVRLSQWLDIGPLVDELRLFKSEAELACLQTAVDISVEGHRAAMRSAQMGLHEYHLQAAFMEVLMQKGVMETAYPTIVGAGANACVLHYVENRSRLEKGQMVLMDAGAEWQGYAADITRTFPVNGQFSPQQRALYEVVLSAQKSAIQLIKPGLPWGDIQKKVVEILVEGLIDLKILRGNPQDLISNQAYLSVYMHGSGHWLGLDVHDAGAYKKGGSWRLLEPNMVLTVEPGLYIRPSESIDACWHDLGIRIEDDIVVTKTGHRVLSGALEKEIDEIEVLMQ